MEKTQQNISMVLVGDSYTDYSPYSYATTLQANLNGVRIINKGIGGDTAVGLEKRFERDVISLRPDFCFIMIGGNDVLGGEKDVDSVVNRITGMVEKCVDRNIIPILGLYRVPAAILRGRWGFPSEMAQERLDNMVAMHDKLASYGDKNGIDHVELENALFPDVDYYVRSDFNNNDIHPSAKGANKIGNYFSEKITDIINKHKGGQCGVENRTTNVHNMTMVVAGDSFSCTHDNATWVNTAQYEMPGVSIVNPSLDNVDSQACIDGFSVISKYHPDIVFASFGLADCAKDNVDCAKVIQNVNDFVIKCWDIGAIPVFGMVMPTMSQMVDLYGRKKGKVVYDYVVALRDYLKMNVPNFKNLNLIEDILAAIKVNGEIGREYIASDKLHLSLAGAEKVGRYIAEQLKKFPGLGVEPSE